VVVVDGFAFAERIRDGFAEAELPFVELLLASSALGASAGSLFDQVWHGSGSEPKLQARSSVQSGTVTLSANAAQARGMHVCAPVCGVSSPTKRSPRVSGQPPRRSGLPS